jgi:amino acid adenylation domain-containing protein
MNNQVGNPKEFWLRQLQGEHPGSAIPYDFSDERKNNQPLTAQSFVLGDDLNQKVWKLAGGSHHRLHMILSALWCVLLHKYDGGDDILLGTSIFKQEQEAEFINTVLPLRVAVDSGMNFKDLLMRMRSIVTEAVKNQNVAIEMLTGGRPPFRVAVLLDNVQPRQYIEHVNLDILVVFSYGGDQLSGVIEYNPALYSQRTIQRLKDHMMVLLDKLISDYNRQLAETDLLAPGERERLLVDWNDTESSLPDENTIPRAFDKNVRQYPDRVAVSYKDQQITYQCLDHKAAELAVRLQRRGVGPDTIVAVMMERSLEMMVAVMGILKAGGAYLPVEPGTPQNRILDMLGDACAPVLVTTDKATKDYAFTQLQGLHLPPAQPVRTAPRPAIADMDQLPMPDRSLIDYEKYSCHISLTMVRHAIVIQGTRGCPFNCAYCARLWPKKQVIRSAEHIFQEVKRYYDMGFRRFSIIDDIFNLHIKNSKAFFQMIIDHGMDIQLFFPAGLRGDIMTPDYIDLMVEAGTINMSVALETASPRLQKTIGKHLNIEKLRRNLEYICAKHPHVILDLFTMHGFPSETEEEARMTLDFIKGLKWLHFPLINILRIYPDTDMERLAVESGISREAILKAESLAWHDVSDTLPFDKSFTGNVQAEFLDDYFLNKERLLHVLPYQMKALTEDELVQKYDSYLPTDIASFDDLLEFTGITRRELGIDQYPPITGFPVEDLNRKLAPFSTKKQPEDGAVRVLLLDLSISFAEDSQLLEDLFDPPLGLLYLMTYLNTQLGSKVDGKIAKSRIDFDNYNELRRLLEDFSPHIIGIRSLTFYKDFFHKTVARMRQWGYNGAIVAGGPYATNGSLSLLQDPNVDVVVMGEGELTLLELVEKTIANHNTLPPDDVLETIPGLVFVPKSGDVIPAGRHIMVADHKESPRLDRENAPLEDGLDPNHLAYTIFTSGSTGRPKGVMLEHKSVVNLVHGLNQEIYSRHAGPLKVALLAPIVFDASVKQIFAALCLGHTLCIVPEEARLNGLELLRFMRTEGVDVADGTPSHLQLMMESADNGDLASLTPQRYIIGGEELPVATARRFLEACGGNGVHLTNVYGPSECCVDTTAFTMTAETTANLDAMPIGGPLPNVSVYVLNRDLQLQPSGLAGELCIGGIGVSRGYLADKELTEKKFVPNPFVKGGVLYRSGDLVRWLEEGSLEFLGRVDNQVKIRGYRIELGEIETLVRDYPGVSDVAVTVHDGQFICAYIVGEDGIDSGKVRIALGDRLPDYMIPSYFIQIERIPLSHNGKVDRRALPQPETAEGAGYVPPATFTQKRLADIWAAILKRDAETIGIADDFFELGGHSLKAIILVSKIQKELGVKISLADIFKSPTIKKLAELVDAGVKQRQEDIMAVEEKEYYPLSSAQKRQYVLFQMAPDSLFYNKPHILVCEGPLDKETVHDIFRTLIMRHESFRTVYTVVDGQPVQRILREVPFEVEYSEASGNQSEAVVNNFVRPFDLGTWPLIRIGLVKLDRERHILMTDTHHITSDGFSMGIFVKEFRELLAGRPLPPLTLQYKDFADWQNTPRRKQALERQKQFWLEEFAEPPEALVLPYDFPRPVMQSFEGEKIGFRLAKEETLRLKQLARKLDTTLFSMLISIFYLLMAKLSGQEDIVVGTPVIGRRHDDLEPVIGMFVNMLSLRNAPVGEKAFDMFVREVGQRTTDTFENQEYQFEDLVEQVVETRDTGRHPIFDVVFSLQNLEIQLEDAPELEIRGLRMRPFRYRDLTAKFDIDVTAIEAEEQLAFSVEYCTHLFKQDTMRRFINYYITIVSQVIDNPALRIRDIDPLPAEEKERLLIDFDNTEAAYPVEATIASLFETAVERNPEATALVDGDTRMSYRDLNRRANGVALNLTKQGIGPGSIVGLTLKRTPAMLAAILGAAKAGAAYLPVDPDYPEDRISYIKKDSNCALIMADDDPVVMGEADTNPKPAARPQDTLYIIYTSGTTGKPKGVMVENRNVVRLMFNSRFQFDFDSTDIWTLFHSYNFDFSVWEMYGALLYGGRLVIVSRDTAKDTEAFLQLLIDQKVTVLNQTPSAFYNLMAVETAASMPELAVRYVIFGGEALSPGRLAPFYDRYPSVKLVNMFGITETTVHVTFKEIGDTEIRHNVSNIGTPIPTLSTVVLDRHMKPAPTGVAGELCVAGAGVARGYLNRPELTAGRFIENPLKPGQPMYRSGDRARVLESGDMEYLGRIDHQVKIRGHRIELGEVRHALQALEGVSEAVVLAKDENNGNRALHAYLVKDEALELASIKDSLSRRLPDYMIPAFFAPLEKIPLTPNGKVDMKALAALEHSLANKKGEQPANDLERKMRAIWASVLAIPEETIGMEESFFDLGGHSLTATLLASRIHKECFVKIPLAEIFRFPLVRHLADYIATTRRQRYASIPVAEKRDYYPVSSFQVSMIVRQKMTPGSIAFNIPFSYRITGEFDGEKIEETFRRLVNRHQLLRTAFLDVDGQLVQKVLDDVQVRLEYYDLGDDEPAHSLMAKFIRPFVLDRPPLLRLGVARRRGEAEAWMIDMHHIISDGVSHRLLMQEFLALYNNRPLPELRLQYKDFSVWQKGPEGRQIIQEQESFWLDMFSSGAPRLQLATDFPRPDVPDYKGKVLYFQMDRQEAGAMRNLAQEEGTTLFMTLLTVFYCLMFRLSGQEDIVVGTPVAGRRHADLERIIGMFVNTLALRNFPAPQKNFRHLLREIKENTIQCFENQDYYFEDLVDRLETRRDLSRNPLFDVMFVMQNIPVGALNQGRNAGNLDFDIQPLKVEYTTSKYDIKLECFDGEEELFFLLEYATSLFSAKTMETLAAYFKETARDAAADPDKTLSQLSRISSGEQDRYLDDFNEDLDSYYN